MKNYFLNIVVGGAIIGIFLTGFYVNDVLSNGRQAQLNPQVNIHPDNELSNPARYLQLTGNYRPVLFTRKWSIDGLILNNATHTNYKAIRIRVNFYSNTETVIGSVEYVLDQYVPQGMNQPFSLEVDQPEGAVACGWVVEGGLVY
jgi:hypothetical protein